MTKYIFITGGVVSSLGKGIAAASLAAILESRGLKVTLLKLDPYIKVMGFSRDTFYRYQAAVESGGVEALIGANRRKPNPKNRVGEIVESAVTACALK